MEEPSLTDGDDYFNLSDIFGLKVDGTFEFCLFNLCLGGNDTPTETDTYTQYENYEPGQVWISNINNANFWWSPLSICSEFSTNVFTYLCINIRFFSACWPGYIWIKILLNSSIMPSTRSYTITAITIPTRLFQLSQNPRKLLLWLCLSLVLLLLFLLLIQETYL